MVKAKIAIVIGILFLILIYSSWGSYWAILWGLEAGLFFRIAIKANITAAAAEVQP